MTIPSDQTELRRSLEGVTICTVTEMPISSGQTELKLEGVATYTVRHEMTIPSDRTELRFE